jgi:hypothetical protein
MHKRKLKGTRYFSCKSYREMSLEKPGCKAWVLKELGYGDVN